MRHALTTRFVIVVTALLVLVVIAWAGLARIAAEDLGEDRVDEILAVDPSIDDGRELFVDTPGRACASCHSLAAAAIDADGGPPIDALEPTARTTIESLVSGTVPVHDEEGYGTILSHQQIADLAAYLEDAVDAEDEEADDGGAAAG
jgi:mono/diheme cytochrome c family protein